MGWIGYLFAVLAVCCAGWLLYGKLRTLFGGRSGCEHCPYSGVCRENGRCEEKK